jgi:hypothetical protein
VAAGKRSAKKSQTLKEEVQRLVEKGGEVEGRTNKLARSEIRF